MRQRPIVAIDGPSGSGKSTVGKRAAALLGFTYVDTGAMYRAVALRVLAEPDPEAALARAGSLAREARIETSFDAATGRFAIALDGHDVTVEVRGPDAARWASRVAALPEVRDALVAQQRALGGDGGVVMEGRDIGTVVFPDAEVKVFLEAPLGVRGGRRTAEEGREARTVERELADRDRDDSSRAVAPLRMAADALRIDTADMDAEAVATRVVRLVRERSAAR